MERLRDLRKQKGLYQKDVAAYLGVDRTTYVKYEKGSSEPDTSTLTKLAEFFDVTVDYILGRENDVGNNDILPAFDNIFPITRRKYPLLGEIACGEPIYADEHRESYILSGTEIQADFCLRAKGDSMIGARILDGDIVFIRKMPIVENGTIAAVIINDEATLKRVYYFPQEKRLRLQAENPAYKTLEYFGEELDTIRILGKAVAFQSDVL